MTTVEDLEEEVAKLELKYVWLEQAVYKFIPKLEEFWLKEALKETKRTGIYPCSLNNNLLNEYYFHFRIKKLDEK